MSALYDHYVEEQMNGNIDLANDTIKAILVDLNDISVAITAATEATPIVITADAHGHSTGDRVSISGVVGNTAANGVFRVTVSDVDTFSLDGSVSNGAWSSGGLILDLTNDQNLDDIAAGARVATGTLASKTVSSSGRPTFDADDLTFTSVTGDECETIILYKDSGVEGTSTLILALDQNDVTGLPVTPGGGNIDITWNANGIIRYP